MHCDIKPDNIMVDDNEQVFLIDFGLAHQYTTRDNGRTVHVPYQKAHYFKGTWYFSSLNQVHMLLQTRRDDLESFLYSYLFLLDVDLPWRPQNKAMSRSQKIKEVRRKKTKLSDEKFESRLPADFRQLFRVIRSTTTIT